ncbi:MAG TPA: flagellar M-ring protein FliF [Candidatus Tetragenococcus pullicola]|nr:flagellar M-ring protein FliF [Candidatus Tetragenococcus pullicola]
MGETIKRWLENMKEKWKNLNKLKQIAILVGLLSLFIASGIFYFVMHQVDYGVLFSDLTKADAGTITSDLKEKNIAYKLEDGGKTILVDRNQIDEYRIDLAVDDKLPDSSTGFELFDDSGMMTTDEDRKIMYQRALSGELERSISALDGIEKAKVILVTPEESVFSEKEKEATASVMLTLKKPLSDKSVQGIVTLTAGAVENLNPDNIKVVDDSGNVLAGGQEDKELEKVNDRYIAIKSTYEKSLEEKVKELLEPIYGTDKMKVSVNVDLNFDSVEKTTTTYNDPEVRSENVQASGDADAVVEAQTGQADDNVSVVTDEDSENGRHYERSVNNELDTEITKTISAPGMVERVTSSVVVNGELPKNMQQELRTLVASAVGFDENRGDEITVQGLNFYEEKPKEDEKTKAGGKTNLNKLAGYLIGFGVALLLILIAIGIVVVTRNRRKKVDFIAEEEPTASTDASEEMMEALAKINERLEKTETFQQEQAIVEPEEPIEEIEDEEESEEEWMPLKVEDESLNNKKAKKYAVDNPEVAAELIKAWLKNK